MIDRSVGDFPEQQRPPGPDPEMSGGLPGVQESPVCKVSPSLYPLLPSLYPDLYRLCIFGGYITIAISHFHLYKLYILDTSVNPLKRKKTEYWLSELCKMFVVAFYWTLVTCWCNKTNFSSVILSAVEWKTISIMGCLSFCTVEFKFSVIFPDSTSCPMTSCSRSWLRPGTRSPYSHISGSASTPSPN